MTLAPQSAPVPWWVERWLQLLDSYRFKKRLERARNYAREGNVLSLEFDGAELVAEVQGSEAAPYRVRLWLDAFSAEDWDYVLETLASKAFFSAQLLGGQLPERVEQAFIQNGLSLFPYNLGEVQAQCSCPDQANPCKHIGAVYYQLAERFQEDPFIIFQLRGRSREELLTALGRRRRGEVASATPETFSAVSPGSDAPFWDYDAPLPPDLVALAPSIPLPNPWERLGSLPLPYETEQEIKNVLAALWPLVQERILAQSLGEAGG
ncbi:MAG: SWIM zinc finger family protein [Cyanobacteriota bacterium]|nr:SWIM zinc finger family protein [Cyanobacteriota bacterium]